MVYVIRSYDSRGKITYELKVPPEALDEQRREVAETWDELIGSGNQLRDSFFRLERG